MDSVLRPQNNTVWLASKNAKVSTQDL